MQITNVFDRSRRILALGILASSLTLTLTRGATLLVYNNNNFGAGSLRQAISDNNALGGGNAIIFSNIVTGTITLTSGELLITRDVTIVGPGAAVLSISGNAVSRICTITNAAIATISDLTITGGRPTDTGVGNAHGGGIRNYATLFLSRCMIVQNSIAIAGYSGAGLYNSGTAQLRDCTFQNNKGGAIWGGAVANYGALTATNCTFTGNSAPFGGGIANYSQLAVSSCTFLGNYSDNFDSGGIWNTGAATVGNSIMASNPPGSDVFGVYTSQGYNFVGVIAGSTGFNAVGDQTGNTNALLGPLQNNGGPVYTLAPLSNSPVIDHGNSGGTATDQRGRPRPYDNPGIINATLGDGADIGAVEVGPVVVTTTNDTGAGSLRQSILSASVQESTITFASNVVGTITLTNGDLAISKDLTIVGPGARAHHQCQYQQSDLLGP